MHHSKTQNVVNKSEAVITYCTIIFNKYGGRTIDSYLLDVCLGFFMLGPIVIFV